MSIRLHPFPAIGGALALALCGFVTACGDDAADSEQQEGSAPTWHQDVAPIIANHCQRCHEEGGIGPFPLVTYAEAEASAAAIAAATASRRMPPFLADNSGSCNTWRDANWLSGEDIDTLGRWARTGAQEGEALPPPTPPSLPSLETPFLSLDMPEAFTPDDALSDEYRCFVVDPGLTETAYVTAYDVVPGEPRVVHHVILYALNSAEAEAAALEKDGEGGRPGYTCFGGAGVSSTMLAAWAPGTGAVKLPSGSGIELTANRRVVMQVHYNTVNGTFPDKTSVRLNVSEQVATPGIMSIFSHSDLEIPAGLKDHEETMTRSVKEAGGVVPIKLWGILPHMHELGTTIRIERLRDGESMCLIDVAAWDFNWQLGYFLETPIDLLPTDDVRITCHFDSRSRTETTRYGEGTQDEMCLAPVFVTVAE